MCTYLVHTQCVVESRGKCLDGSYLLLQRPISLMIIMVGVRGRVKKKPLLLAFYDTTNKRCLHGTELMSGRERERRGARRSKDFLSRSTTTRYITVAQTMHMTVTFFLRCGSRERLRRKNFTLFRFCLLCLCWGTTRMAGSIEALNTHITINNQQYQN